MKKIFPILLVLFAISFLVGCDHEVPVWAGSAEKAAADGAIDCDEFQKLADLVLKSKDEADKKYISESGEVDNEKFTKAVFSFLKGKSVSIKQEDICNPASKRKFDLNVFIENSGSMDGYVKGATEFEAAIYSLLGAMNSEELVSNLSLNYINNQIIPFEDAEGGQLNDRLRKFIADLEPEEFAKRGGIRGNSDLRSVIKMSMEKSGGSSVSMLVSDFILSFRDSSSVEESLTREKISITNDVREHMKKNPDFGIMVLHLESRFNGPFYDYRNTVIPLNRVQRPYYLWLMGSNKDLKRIIDSGVIDGMSGGVKNRAIFASSQKPAAINYKILLQPKVGEFELADGAKAIVGARPARDEKNNFVFSFAVAADFSKQLAPLELFDSPGNYEMSDDNYSVTVERVKKDNDKLAGFTHRLVFKTSKFKHGDLKVELKAKFPEWVARHSADDGDSDIETNDETKTQTFGLSYMLGALQDAFYPNERTVFNSMTFRVEK
jgi:hypothetical protein